MFLVWLLCLIVLFAAGLVWFAARTQRRVEAAVPPVGQFITVDGQRLHYVDTGGDGPAIVMIHGLGGSLWNFTYALVDRLAGDFRVIALDRPGAGYSGRADGAAANPAAQAATIARFIQALKLDRPLVVGHSLGGVISLALALNHPQQVGGLALVAPLTHPQEAEAGAFKGLAIPSPALRRIIAWTTAIPMTILSARAVMKFVFAPDPAPEDFGTRGGGLLGLRPGNFYNTSSDLLAAGDDLPDMTARYPSLSVPFGMIYGRGDTLLDYRLQGEAMKQKTPDLDLVLLDGRGHMLPITAPDDTAALIRSVAARM
ncbi:alpha/beta hydrolase [Camelimonas fluminis]|uniref:Alpha/beta fold hydrolase n=1 Tax=Camelimonas fluminis TaxID=1576911 RepID=A0ABV7UJ87_9HYPH|nr:alpha/beta hydrolase [Camelimonas fluminis]GHE67542.1 alpha/beta hydrolase [Camelimonas fluminis]